VHKNVLRALSKEFTDSIELKPIDGCEFAEISSLFAAIIDRHLKKFLAVKSLCSSY